MNTKNLKKLFNQILGVIIGFTIGNICLEIVYKGYIFIGYFILSIFFLTLLIIILYKPKDIFEKKYLRNYIDQYN